MVKSIITKIISVNADFCVVYGRFWELLLFIMAEESVSSWYGSVAIMLNLCMEMFMRIWISNDDDDDENDEV